MQIPDPEMQSPRIGGNRARANRNSKALVTQTSYSESTADRQAQRVAKLFRLTSSVASVIAELAFSGCER